MISHQPGSFTWMQRVKSSVVFLFPPIFLYLAAQILFSTSSTPIWDAEQQQMPYFGLLADSARSFTPVVWNPYSSGGAPDYAISDFFLLSPITAAIAFVCGSGIASYQMYWFLIWVAGAWGVVMLGRHFKAPDWGICVINAGFLFSGFYCGHAQNPSAISAMSALPWIVWRLDVALSERRFFPALEAGAIWGATATCSYIGLTALTGCYCGLWVLGRILFSDESRDELNGDTIRKRSWFGLGALALLGCVGVIVMLPNLSGMLVEIKGYSDRAEVLSREVVISENVIAPGSLFSLASPYVSSLKYWNESLWPNTNVCLLSVYSGAAALVLAVMALLTKHRTHWRMWVFAVGAFCVVASLGYHTPVRGWLYDYFYPSRYFRHPGLFRMYWIFTVVVLALYASRDLQLGERETWRRLFPVACVLGGVGVVWMMVFKSSLVGNGPQPGLANAHGIGIWGGLAVVCWFACSENAVFRQRYVPCALVLVACIDGAVAFQLNRALMCQENPSDLKAWHEILAQYRPNMNLGPKAFERVLNTTAPEISTTHGMLNNANLYSKQLVLRNYTPLSNAFHLELSDTPVLAQSALGAERIWFAATVPEIAPTQANFAAYKARALELNAAPIVRHSRESVLKPGANSSEGSAAEITSLQAPQKIPVVIAHYSFQRLTLNVDAPRAGWLLVTERWARGWNATVDGRAVDVQPGNFVFRCVAVPAGASTVDFTYTPFGFPYVLYASFGMLGAVMIVSVGARVRRRRS